MKRVAYIGNFSVAHSTEQHVRQSIESLNVPVIPIQENKYSVKEIDDIIFSNPVDMVLYTRTWGLDSKDCLKLWSKCKNNNIPTVSYHLDLYHGIARKDLYKYLRGKGIKSISDDPFWRTEYVFTVDGDPTAQKYFESLGVNHHYLCAGVFDKECFIHENYADYLEYGFKYDIIFVGSEGYHPEFPYRPKLISWLRENYGDSFRKFGGAEGTFRNDQLNELYASAKIVVGDSLNPGFAKSGYWSDRIYETTGRGGFIIHPFINGLETQFENGKEVCFYQHGNLNDLKEKIDYYLVNDQEREDIRINGFNRTLKNHTYRNRMRVLLNKVLYNI